jgi:hypothetical protein
LVVVFTLLPLLWLLLLLLHRCSRAGLLASTYLEVQEVQQLKETYDEALVRPTAAQLQERRLVDH